MLPGTFRPQRPKQASLCLHPIVFLYRQCFVTSCPTSPAPMPRQLLVASITHLLNPRGFQLARLCKGTRGNRICSSASSLFLQEP